MRSMRSTDLVTRKKVVTSVSTLPLVMVRVIRCINTVSGFGSTDQFWFKSSL